MARLVAILAMMALGGIGLSAWDRLHQRDAAMEQAARLVGAAVAAALPQEGLASPAERQRFCRQLLNMPAASAVVLWASGPRIVESAYRHDWSPIIERPEATDATPMSIRRLPVNSSFVQVDCRLTGADSSGVGLTLSMLFDERQMTESGALSPIFTWIYLPAAGIGGVWSIWLVRREVDRPLAKLLVAAGQCKNATSPPPLTTRDEWGIVERGLRESRERVSEWKDHARRIERRMESRLAEQTRQVTQNLRRVQREIWEDPLTGTKNRRLLEEKFPTIFKAQRAAGEDLSVIMIDLDYFKRLNDTAGHRAGDDLLVFAGELLRQSTRSTDIVVRYGGDEFVVILPGVTVEKAAVVGNRIMVTFARQARVLVNVNPAPSMTVGVASLLHCNPRSPAALLAAADRALYEAKQEKRGTLRIGSAEASPPRPAVTAKTEPQSGSRVDRASPRSGRRGGA